MEEAGLISAAVGAAPEVEATVAAPRAQRQPRRIPAVNPRPSRLRPEIRATVAIAATVLAFAASLVSLGSVVRTNPALDLAAAAPAVGLTIAVVVRVRRGRSEVDIHDRYLDYILGLGLIGLATIGMRFLPGALSIFFWSWRLDLVALPLFLAGAIALLCGSRALWRYRLPVAIPFLAWPLPYVALGLAAAPAWVGVMATLAGAAVLTLILGFKIPLPLTGEAGNIPSPARGGGSGRGLQVGGGLIASLIVVAAALLTAAADQAIGPASRLLLADGQPTVASTSAHTINGLVLAGTTDPPSFPLVAPPLATTAVYAGASGQLPSTGKFGGGTAVERAMPGDPRALALLPSALAIQQGYRLERSREVDLGSGVAGSVETYAAPDQQTALVLVWWDWPVQSGGAVQRERVIVEREFGIGATDEESVLAFARALVAGSGGR